MYEAIKTIFRHPKIPNALLLIPSLSSDKPTHFPLTPLYSSFIGRTDQSLLVHLLLWSKFKYKISSFSATSMSQRNLPFYHWFGLWAYGEALSWLTWRPQLAQQIVCNTSFKHKRISVIWHIKDTCRHMSFEYKTASRPALRYLNPWLDLLKETMSSNWEGQSPTVITASDLLVLTL